MYTIRKAAVTDNLLINELASQIWKHTYGSILTKEQLDYMFDLMYAPENIVLQIQELKHQYFILYAETDPCGYLSIEQVNDDLFILQKIYLLPSIQGKGAGRYLIEQGISYIKTIHPQPCKVQLYVNRSNKAVDFYKKMNFCIIDTRDYNIGNNYFMNDYILECNI